MPEKMREITLECKKGHTLIMIIKPITPLSSVCLSCLSLLREVANENR
jgi:hypothetical protein